jgi:hypothetical protein
MPRHYQEPKRCAGPLVVFDTDLKLSRAAQTSGKTEAPAPQIGPDRSRDTVGDPTGRGATGTSTQKQLDRASIVVRADVKVMPAFDYEPAP